MPQESKFYVRRREFAQVIAKHFISHHITNKDHSHIHSITPQNRTIFQIIVIDFGCQTNNELEFIFDFQVVNFEHNIGVQVYFLPSTTPRYRRVRQHHSQFFYMPSTISKEKAKEICEMYTKYPNKIHFAYSVVTDDAGKAIAINRCYQSKITNFFSLELPNQSCSRRQNNPSKDEPSRSCSLM